MNLRPACCQDIYHIAKVWHEGWKDGHTGLVPDELYQYRTFDSFIPRVEERIKDTLVSESADDEINGFVTVKGNELEQIFVAQSYRGTGLAKKLIKAGEDMLLKNGQTDVYLVVVVGNDRARKFYEKSGWILEDAVDYMAQIQSGKLPVKCLKFTKKL